MDLRDFGAALRRRWRLAVLIVVLAAAAGATVATMSGAKYTAAATAALIPPPSTVENATKTSSYAPPNPMMYLNGLGQARDVLVQGVNSEQTSDEVKARVPGATFEVTPDPASSAPLILVQSEARSDVEALSALDVLNSRIPATLNSIQQQLGIPQSNTITVFPLTSDKVATVNRKSQIQLAVTSGFAFLVTALLGLALLDGAASGRHRSARANSSQPPKRELVGSLTNGGSRALGSLDE